MVYSRTDSSATNSMYCKLHNIDVENRIMMLRKAMDSCDDIQMREHLARKLVYEKRKLIKVDD